jgi:hypothetical protein
MTFLESARNHPMTGWLSLAWLGAKFVAYLLLTLQATEVIVVAYQQF